MLIGSGSGIRTARPSGYEPDELPTALSRDIGLQIYGHFLKLQILFTKNVNFRIFTVYDERDLLFHHKHWVPCRKHDTVLIEHLQDILRYIFLLDNETEHVLLEPLIGHDEASLIS